MSFLKYTLATIVGLMIFSLLILFIFIGIGSAASQQEDIKIKDTSVLRLNFDLPIAEKEEENPFEEFGFDFEGSEMGMGLKEIKTCIRNAKEDERIKAIYLNLNGLGAGFAMSMEIKEELESFKESGKPIIAYSAYYSEGAYQLATVADQILLHPMGGVDFNGFNYEMMFFKGTLEKLDIDAEVIRVGKYKSFAEPFILDKMSDENREQISYVVDEIYANFIKEIAESRGKTDSVLYNMSNTYELRLAEDALEKGMVDKLVNHDEAIATLKESIGVEADEKIELVGYKKYKKVKVLDEGSSKDRIAVLVAEGEIRMGQSEDGVLGARTFAKEMKKLRESDRVKAIVIRVNSPGGSAVASQIMEREIELTREVKPVVASMSDVAASGGYWISMGCDRIYAQENTITGSIGVIGLLFNVERFLKNKLGITIDKVKTGEFADLGNGTHAMTDEERAIIQEAIDEIYDEFTQKVADYRGVSVDHVLENASGRIWTGKQALDRKLVDELGDLDDAIIAAAELAELEAYKVRFYPPKENFLEKFMGSDKKDEMISKFIHQPTELEKLILKLETIQEQEGVLARMPYGLEFNY